MSESPVVPKFLFGRQSEHRTGPSSGQPGTSPGASRVSCLDQGRPGASHQASRFRRSRFSCLPFRVFLRLADRPKLAREVHVILGPVARWSKSGIQPQRAYQNSANARWSQNWLGHAPANQLASWPAGWWFGHRWGTNPVG